MEPEARMVDPSLLTKFRKTRITEDILEEMLKETIQQALDKGLIKSGTIISTFFAIIVFFKQKTAYGI